MRHGSARSYLVSVLLLIGLLLIPLRIDAEAPGRLLIHVPTPSQSLLGDLLARGILVVQADLEHLLVVGSEEDVRLIEQLGATTSVLDRNVDGKSYYTVLPTGAESVGQLDAVRVLHEGVRPSPSPTAGYLIVEATLEEAVALGGVGAEIARVFLRPVRLPTSHELRRPRERRTEIDPWIASQVDLVDGSRINATVQRLQNFVTRYATHDSCLAAAGWIAEQFVSLGIEDVSFHEFGSQFAPNVIAVIPGAGTPSEQIVIGGHYDSMTSNSSNCPGADDNASGTAGILECARILAQGTYDRTIVVIAYGAEEFGLVGSEAYAQEAALRGDDIIASIAVDMIGYLADGDARDLDIISNSSSEWLRTLVIETAADYVPATPSIPGSIPSGASSDHYSFWQAGYDAVLFFEDSGNFSPYIHTSADVVGVSYISPELALDSTRILTAVTATLARPFEISIQHDPLEDTEETVQDYRIEATIRGAHELDPSTLLVHVSTDLETFSLPLLPSGAPDVFEAWIPAQAQGTFVDYFLTAGDVTGNDASHPDDAPNSTHRFFVGTSEVVFFDDFESAQGWAVGAPDDGATSGIWVRVDPNGTWSGTTPVQPEDDHTNEPGVTCFVTGNASPGATQGDEDVDGGRTTLTSPRIDLAEAAAAWLRYHRWYTNDTGSGPRTDEWTVDVSNDDGDSWQTLETTGASHQSWKLVELEISALLELTGEMRFRFIAADDEPGSIVEAAIDDLEVRAFFQDSSEVDPDPVWPRDPGLSIVSCAPNPFSDEIEVRYFLPSGAGHSQLSVHDITGRKIAVLGTDSRATGSRRVSWQARDARGKPLPSGVYFLRLSDGRSSRIDRILRIR